MGTLSVRGRFVVMATCLATVGALYACTAAEDENPAPARSRTDDASPGPADTVSPQGTATPTGTPVCAKFGGYDQVKAMAVAILEAGKIDCRIASVVTKASQHTTECFQAFIGGGFQCPGITYADGVTVDSKKEKCNNILPGLKFSNEDWKVLIDFNANPPSIAKAQVTAKAPSLVATELQSIAIIFEGKKAGLLQGLPNKFTACLPNCTLGGEACIQPIIDGGPDPIIDSGPPDTGAPIVDSGATDQ